MLYERHYNVILNFEIDFFFFLFSLCDCELLGGFVKSVPEEAMVQCHTGERRGLSRLCDAYR